MRNFKLTVAYDGTDFNGWQFQPGQRTVQEVLEQAIATVVASRSHANASGRTDAGVHAVGQVVNFRTETRLTPETLLRAINANLPPDVVVRDARVVDERFDATRDALRKLYRYVIRDNPVGDPFQRRYQAWIFHRLDVPAMDRAAQCLIGTHDFRSFESEWPNRMSSVRTITQLTVTRSAEQIWIDVEADGFLYNMVRAIAGTLINVGRGFWLESKVAEILAAEDRNVAGPTAPACGLHLMRVTYG
ncbi:MAG TPA: tRNA pseudouridine(38-40) synthase TruA [Gemmataceae bacterium]|jgi:tRNA pseudouridine38-40 synthase|nr:tRNA pseudouridine(38-40) synthase TruA [Gemmataceae bacterium]